MKISSTICIVLTAILFSGALSHVDDAYLDLDHLLCRKCGADATDIAQENFFNITGPASEGKEILRPTNLYLQKLTNPGGVTFKVLTLYKAGCIGVGEWQSEYSWFPHYSWKVCICRHCKEHLGWIFRPNENFPHHLSKAAPKGFYGLIWNNLIQEEFSNSLLLGIPKSKKL